MAAALPDSAGAGLNRGGRCGGARRWSAAGLSPEALRFRTVPDRMPCFPDSIRTFSGQTSGHCRRRFSQASQNCEILLFGDSTLMVNSGIISVSQRNPPESTLKERSVGKHIAPARGPHQGQGRETGGAKDAAGRQEKSRRCPMFRGARPRAKVLYAATGARSETRRQRKNRKVFRRLGQSTKSLDSVWRPMETAPRKRFRWALARSQERA